MMSGIGFLEKLDLPCPTTLLVLRLSSSCDSICPTTFLVPQPFLSYCASLGRETPSVTRKIMGTLTSSGSKSAHALRFPKNLYQPCAMAIHEDSRPQLLAAAPSTNDFGSIREGIHLAIK